MYLDPARALLLYTVLQFLLTTMGYTLQKGEGFKLGRIIVSFSPGLVMLKLGKRVEGRGVSRPFDHWALIMIVSLFAGMILFYTSLFPSITVFISRTLTTFIGGKKPIEIIPPVAPILPGITISLSSLPYILSAIGAALVLHEGFHAYFALREGVAVRSWGIGLMLLFPIAFVEVDESAMERVSLWSKLKIIGAGILANLLLAVVALALLGFINVTYPADHVQALKIVEVSCSVCGEQETPCPAKLAGFRAGDIIVGVNGTPMRTFDDLRNVLKVGNVSMVSFLFTLCGSNGECRNVTVHATPSDGRVCLGVKLVNTIVKIAGGRVYEDLMFIGIVTLLQFMYIVNMSLFVINAAPLFITDGAKALDSIIESLKSRGIVFFLRRFLTLLQVVNVILLGAAIILSIYVLV
ncbi:MAG: hypothetical protein DRO12_02525 [Thermoprotei archaeon]|nr:MAG: hypothetical protein DRO12_02525 [Thermoprotei archaeon]